MNEQIKELESRCWEERPYGPPWFDAEKFAELLLKKTFTIIAESMIDTDADLKIDEIIADRLDQAAVDVCDELGIINGIYRV
jgi:hypothetical protein